VERLLKEEKAEEAFQEADQELVEHPGNRPLRVVAVRALVRWQMVASHEREMFDCLDEFALDRFAGDPEVAWAAGDELSRGYSPRAVLPYWDHALQGGIHRRDPRVFEQCVKDFRGDWPDALARTHRIARTWFDAERTGWARNGLGGGSSYGFLNALAKRTGCGFILDVYNLECDAYNHGFDIQQFLSELEMTHVREVHLAGGVIHRGLKIDVHSRITQDSTIALARQVIAMAPNVETITYELLPEALPRMGYDGLVTELKRLRQAILN